MQINVKRLVNGTKADANDVNDIAATIVGVVNGNVNTDNLANDAVTRDKVATNSITTSKIVNKAVTNDKIDINPVQTNNTPELGSTYGYYRVGNVLTQYGIEKMSSSGTKITFPVEFGRPPVIQLTTYDPNNQQPWVKAVTAKDFTGAQQWAPSTVRVYWLAIGPAKD